MSALRVQFTKTLGSTKLDVSLTLPGKGITAIFGRSGAGKTSLINVISGLISPDSGEITIQERVLFQPRTRHQSADRKAPDWLCVSGSQIISTLHGAR